MVFFALSIAMYLVQNFSNKQFSRMLPGGSMATTLVQNGLCVLSAGLCLGLLGGLQALPPEVILLALVFGFFYLLTVFLLLKAFTLGSMGGSTLLCNVGMFISTFYGILRFSDAFTAPIAVGGVLMFLAVVLSTPLRKGEHASKSWFVVALLSGLSNGVVASVKREAVALCADALQSFLMLGFLFAAVIALVAVAVTADGRHQAVGVLRRPKALLCGIFAGIGTAGANFFQMQALRSVSSAVVYPLTSGFLVVSLWLVSFLFYREEKLTWRNVLAVVFCVLAIVLVNLK